MLLKLETFVEVNTKEPQAVKQCLNHWLTVTLQTLHQNAERFESYYGEKSLLIENPNVLDFYNPTFVGKDNLITIQQFAHYLNFFKVKVPTEEQVLERIRKGLEDKRS